MKKILSFVFCAALFLGCGEKHYITVDRLVSMSKINVLYVAVAEVYSLETKDGSTALSRLVRGGAYYSIDLSKIKISPAKVESGAKVEISLPTPSLESFPDPRRSIEFKPKVKVLVNDKGLKKIRELYDQKDKEKIAAAASKPEYMKMAKKQGEKILRDMLPELKVSIKWREQP